MEAKSLLVTGPIEGAERYAAAARAAGWEALVHPLLAIWPVAVDLAAELERARSTPAWVCVTSRHALPAVEAAASALRGVPCATVGEASARRLRDAGLEVALAGAASAAELAERLGPRLEPGGLVLWPRGSRSDELAVALRASGAEVLAPVVYETLERHAEAAPHTTAVFFASPSAVEAWIGDTAGDPPAPSTAERSEGTVAGAHATRPAHVLAIGATTARAVERHADRLPAPTVLDEPSPQALAKALDTLAPAKDDA